MSMLKQREFLPSPTAGGAHSRSNEAAPAAPTAAENPLQTFEQLRDQIRDRVEGVARHYHHGLYLAGRGGTSKTYTVEESLKRTGTPWILRSGHMTPLGLFSVLENYPDHVVVLDDVGGMFRAPEARQILLAALGGPLGASRPVSYVRDKKNKTVLFNGGIIAISNLPLAQDPVLNALRSRIPCVEFEPTDDQVAAFMLQLAGQGHLDVGANECIEVARFVIHESTACDHRLDLRDFTKAVQDFRQCRDGHAKTRWQDLVRSGLRHRLVRISPPSKAEQMEEECRLAERLTAKYPGRNQRADRDHEWRDRTGKSPDTMYRHLRKAQARRSRWRSTVGAPVCKSAKMQICS